MNIFFDSFISICNKKLFHKRLFWVVAAVIILANGFFISSAQAGDNSQLASDLDNAETFLNSAPIGDLPGDYTQTAADEFQAAIDYAIPYNSSSYDQGTLDSVDEDLVNAMSEFESSQLGPSDPSTLEGDLSYAQSLVDGAVAGVDFGDYPAAAISTLQDEINQISGYGYDENSAQGDIDAADAEINVDIATFQNSEVTTHGFDYLAQEISSARGLLDSAQIGAGAGQYSAWAAAIFHSAIDDASVYYKNSDLDAINDAYLALNDAMTTFAGRVFSDLNALKLDIATAESLHDQAIFGTIAGRYPTSSIADLQTAIDAVPALTSTSSQSLIGMADNKLSDAIAAFRGNVSGSFGQIFKASVSYGTGSTPVTVVTGDFNNDGFPDFAAANYSGNNVSVFLNNKDGTFAPAVNYTVGNEPWVIVASDFNKDGNIDLATANFNGNNISVLTGAGDGTFAPAVNYTISSNGNPDSILAADFNSDGYPDLAVTTYSGNKLYILMNNGAGSFSITQNYSAGTTPWYLASGDFNGDGKTDLALLNRGAGYGLEIFLGAGDGTFAAPIITATGLEPRGILVHDLNSDGKDDLVIGNSGNNNISVYLSTSDGNFSAPVNYPAGNYPTSIVGGDFNHDGILDLAVANYYGKTISLLMGSGGASFGTTTNIIAGNHPAWIASADFNNDSYPDLVAANQSGNDADVFMNAKLPVVLPDLSSLTLDLGRANNFLINAMAGAGPGRYPADNISALQTAFDTAMTYTVYDDQATIDSADTTLNEAISTFQSSQIPVSDLTTLEEDIELAQGALDSSLPGQYPTAALLALQQAISSASLYDKYSVQADIDAADTSLQNAVSLFEASTNSASDLSAINTDIASAQTVLDAAPEGDNIGQYSAGVLADLQYVIDVTSAFTEYSDQADINAGDAALNDAVTFFQASVNVPTVRLINSCQDLQDIDSAIGNDPAAAYYDYEINVPEIDCGESAFNPIIHPFYGTLNGNGAIISNLFISDDSDNNVGLFGDLESGAVIKNLTLSGSSVSSSYSGGEIGVLAGYAYGNVTIQNVTSTVTDLSGDSGSAVGGLVGYYEDDDAGPGLILNNVKVSTAISATNDSQNVGGLIGDFEADGSAEHSITDSNFSGSISGGGSQAAGGLIGYIVDAGNDVISIDNSSVSSDQITGGSNTGGLIGIFYLYGDPKLTINDSGFSGRQITGIQNVGGLLGLFQNFSEAYSQINLISHSYSTGNIESSGGNDTGGLIGQLQDNENCSDVCPGSLIILASHASGDVSGNQQVGGLIGAMERGNFLLENSYASGNVSGSNQVGGLVGDTIKYESLMSIDRSYASGIVSGSGDYVGGLVGYFQGDGNLSNSFGTSETSGGGSNVGGLVGNADNENDLVNNYWYDSLANGVGNGGEDTVSGHFSKADSAESFQNNSTNPPLDQWNFSGTNPIWLAQDGDYPSFNSDYLSTTTVYTLNYSAGTGGSVSGGSQQYVPAGADGATVTAVPDAGYQFVNWSDDSTANPRTDVNVTDDISVTANFALAPYQITSCQDLQDIDSLISDNPAAAYNDYEINVPTIDCSDVNGTGNFAPIENLFYGTLNGNGVKIINFNTSDDNDVNVGLFGDLESGATVKNLSLSGDSVSSSYGYKAVLAGYAHGDITIQNVTSTVSELSADNVYEIGGLIGYYNDDGGSTLVISNAHVSTSISAVVNNGQDVGGLIGYIQSSADGVYSITNSDFSGTISAAGSESAGGLIGWIAADAQDIILISSSSASGDISGGSDDSNAGTGGLIGFFEMGGDTQLTISHSHYSGGQISDGDSGSYGDSVGGLIGIYDNDSSDYSQANIIDHSYSSGNIASFGDNNFVGGLIGQVINAGNCSGDCSGGSFGITDSYSSGDVTGDPADADGFVGGLVGSISGRGISTVFSVASSSVSGNVSGDDQVGGLIGYAESNINLQNVTSSISALTGEGDSQVIGGLIGQYYDNDPGIGLLIDDAYVSSTISGVNSGNSTEVGGMVGDFTADGGADHSITNSRVSGSITTNGGSKTTGGVFGTLDDYGNDNISFSNIDVSSDISGGYYAGGLIGRYYFEADSKLSITDCGFSGDEIDGYSYSGGLLGGFENDSSDYSQIDVISHDYSTGKINSPGYDFIGGLIGQLLDDGICGSACTGGLLVSASYASGDVTGNSFVGGLVGQMQFGNFSIEDSYAGGEVSGIDYAGGLVGDMNMSLPIMSVSRSYAFGAVSASDDYAGGLVGNLESGNLSDSFSVGDVSSGGLNVGGLVGNAGDENNLQNDYWFDPLANGVGNGTEDTSSGHFIKVDSADSFQNNDTNLPLDKWNFSSGNPIWSVQAGEYPALNPDHTSSATAYLLQYSSGGNGTISGSANQFAISGADGTAVTAVPDDGYVFVNWSDNSTANPRTDIAVNGDISVTANFYFDPFQEITTCQELQDIDALINDNMDAAFDYYQIATSSTLDCSTVNGTGIFAPISNIFYGTLDGNGAKIINLNLADDDSNSVGIFSDLGDGATVKNVSLSGSSQAVNATYIGAIAGVATGNITIQNVTSSVSNLTGEESGGLIGGYAYNLSESDSGPGLTMDNVHVSSDILVDGSDAGGLIGDFDSAGTVQHSITNSSFSGSFSGSNGSYVGGLIAVISSDYQDNFLIDNCSSTGDILAPGYEAGGLLGAFSTGDDSQLTISHSHFSGSEIDGYGPTGGLIGYTENNSSNPTRISVISQSYSQGTINSTSGDAGGLVGEMFDSVNCGDSCISGFVISDSYSSADVNAVDSDLAGGLVGEMNNPNVAIMNSYASGNITGNSYIGGLVGDMYQTSPVMSIDRSYFSGSVSGDGAFVGGLVGDLEGTSVLSNSFNVGEISSSGIPGALVGSADNENNLINDYWFNSLDNGVGNGAEDTSLGHFIKADSADSFQGNDTNPPLNQWNFSGPNPNWVSADGLYPALNADHSSNTSVYVLQYSAGANGSITGAATQFVLSGTDGIVVTAAPDDGYHFVNWSDDSTDNPRTDTGVTKDISVTANFELNSVTQYTLTYDAGANGSIDGDSPQTVDSGSDGTPVTAVAADGYHFVDWSDASTTNPRIDYDVTGDITVTANFAADSVTQYTLTYAAGANGSIDGDSPQTVDSGSDGTAVTAEPAAGYHFVDWSDASTTNPRIDYDVTGDITVTANFAINTYTLTYTAGDNGLIDGDSPQTVDYSADGTAVTAVADDGFHFVNWSDNSTDNPRADTGITGDISVTANFAADLVNQFTLAYAAGAGGLITGSSTQIVNSGADGTAVTAEPDSGYHFVNWSDNSTDNPRTDLAVGGDISVTANFAANPVVQYTLAYLAGAHGSITGSSTQIVTSSSNGTAVTAEPAAGYHFVDWSDASTTNPRTDYDVTQDISVTANFAANPVTQYTLIYAAGAHGTITGNSPQTVNSGFDGTAVTAVPNSGYRFVNWSDNSTVNPRTDRNVSGDISVTATFEIIPVQSGGGGSGPISIPACSAVVYGNWGNCVNGIQYRNILSQSTASCPLTTAQQAARSMVCGIVPVTPIVTSTIPVPPVAPVIPGPPSTILQVIANEAGIINAGNLQSLLSYLGKTADPAGEQASFIKYKIILNQDSKITATQKTAVNDFIVYGTPATYRLGSGERAGVINSYFQAYGKLPSSESDWSDVIKIADGRWPSERNAAAENQAKLEFWKVYGRYPVLTNTHDQNAVIVIAYGLIPLQRHLASEAAAIKIFSLHYGHAPANALAWNIVRAIAYSGATR